MTITIHEARTDAELEAWRRVRLEVIPGERALTVAEMRAALTPERRYLLALFDGELAGSGLVGRSSYGYAGLHPRVLPAMRRRGIGTALLQALGRHALAAGFEEAGSEADGEGSLAFAQRFRFVEVARQVEQLRTIGAEAPPQVPEGIRIVTVEQRPDLWDAAYDQLVGEAIADMATVRPIHVSREEWRREWLAWPAAMFLALDGDRVVGCAGLERDADHPERAENALTAVARTWRRRGVATALKQATLAFAAANGVREVYTWTQAANADMRALNERLGYRPGHESITVRGDLAFAERG